MVDRLISPHFYVFVISLQVDLDFIAPTLLLSVDKFDCLSRDAQRLGKVSGGGLELGVLQPAVSTCFTFTSLLPKVGYFWIFYCKCTLTVDTNLL